MKKKLNYNPGDSVGDPVAIFVALIDWVGCARLIGVISTILLVEGR